MCRRWVSLLVSLSLIFYLTGCSSMRYISLDEMSEVERESSVWVTMADGNRYELKEPKLNDSKLVGYIEPEGYRELAASEIESLAVKELDRTTTIALGVCGFVGAILLVSSLSGDGGDGGSCST